MFVARGGNICFRMCGSEGFVMVGRCGERKKVSGFCLSSSSMLSFMDILFHFPDWLSKKSADQGEFLSGNSQIEQWINPPYSARLRQKDPLFPNIVWFMDFDLQEILVQFLDWLSKISADRRGFCSGNPFPIPSTLFLLINPQTALRAYHVSSKSVPSFQPL